MSIARQLAKLVKDFHFGGNYAGVHLRQTVEDITWQEAILFTQLIEQIPDNKLTADFLDGKYGTYFRNLQGTIEHGHYHLGQISLIKKLLRQQTQHDELRIPPSIG